MSGKYSKILLFWSVLFIISAAIVFISWGAVRSSADGRPPDPEEGEQSSLPTILGVVSALTSAGGFIVTTFFALRADKRDNTMHQLQIEQLKQEIEEKNLDLERARKQEPPP